MVNNGAYFESMTMLY